MRRLSAPLVQGLLAFAALAVVFAGCHKREPAARQKTLPVVQVARPVVRQVTDYAFFTGRTEAPESVDVQSRVTGYLDSVDFEPGAEVKAKQQLFLVDPRPYQAALEKALGDVKLAEARLKVANADYARAKEIAKTPGAISQQDVDKYEAAASEADAAVAAAEAACEAARLNVEFTSIRSPVDGVVGRNLLTIGNLVKQDTTLLATVVSQDPMYAYFDVDERTLLHVLRLLQEGQFKGDRSTKEIPVELGLADEGAQYPREGQVDFLNNRVDPSTGTLQVRGTFANPRTGAHGTRLLAPGMFVRIRLPVGEPHDALLVPESAIGTDQGRKYLLVVNARDVVEYRLVTLGAQQSDGLQVVLPAKMVRTKDGLLADAATAPGAPTVDSITAEDRVIVSGLQRVKPGDQVEPPTAKTTPSNP